MLDTHYVVFVTKIMFSNIILPILSFCVTNVPDFASIERERERENFIRINAGKTRKANAHQCWCLW